MIGYKMACKVYGIKPLTAEQEKKLSDNEKIIRECKINIINMCNDIRKAVNAIDQEAVNANEIDNLKEMNKLVNLRSELRSISSNIICIAENISKGGTNR